MRSYIWFKSKSKDLFLLFGQVSTCYFRNSQFFKCLERKLLFHSDNKRLNTILDTCKNLELKFSANFNRM